jgi:hypothetical protein
MKIIEKSKKQIKKENKRKFDAAYKNYKNAQKKYGKYFHIICENSKEQGEY